MLNKEQIISKLEENKETIRAFGVKRLILIGSYAKDIAQEDSDIDLLVEFEKNRGLYDDFIHLSQFLRDLFEKNIDLGEEHLLREEIKSHILNGEKIEAKI